MVSAGMKPGELQERLLALWSKVEGFLEGWTSRWFLIRGGVVVFLLASFFQFPNLFEVRDDPNAHFDAILKIKDSPWAQLEFERGSHNEKKTFRLVVPLMARVLGLESSFGIYFLFVVANVVLLVAMLAFLERETGDRVLALLTVCGFSCIYPGCSGIGDSMGFGDVVAYALLMLALLGRHGIIVFLAVFLAAMSDERALAGSGFVVLWWGVRHWRGMDTASGMRIPAGMWAVLGAWVGFLCVRLVMLGFLGFETKLAMVGLRPYVSLEPSSVGVGLWSGLEVFWFWVPLLLLVLWQSRARLWFVWTLLLVGGLVAGALMVADVTKSVAYLFPVVPIVAVLVKRAVSEASQLRMVMMITALICVSTPTEYVFGNHRAHASFLFRFSQLAVRKLILESPIGSKEDQVSVDSSISYSPPDDPLAK